MRRDCSHWLPSIPGAERGEFRILAWIVAGDREFVLVEEGEAASEDSRLVELIVCAYAGPSKEPLSKDFGLSLPVGPLPSAGRFAGGKLRAARKQLFSSSSSETLCSSA